MLVVTKGSCHILRVIDIFSLLNQSKSVIGLCKILPFLLVFFDKKASYPVPSLLGAEFSNLGGEPSKNNPLEDVILTVRVMRDFDIFCVMPFVDFCFVSYLFLIIINRSPLSM